MLMSLMESKTSMALSGAGLWSALFIACSPSSAPAPLTPTELVVITAITPDGHATAPWLTILRSRLSPRQYDSAARLVRVITPEEQAWDSVVRARVDEWERSAGELAPLYSPAGPPRRVRIVLGNRGTEDAFTAGPETIGFDLSSLVSLYGSARDPANLDRINRFFRHEFTHILQKAWLAQHPWNQAAPIDAALFDVWAEGLGNYYSLSERWIEPEGQLSELGTATLRALEPQFVERFSGLACADSLAGGTLLSGLSSGPFAKKWGAVPAALWLATEPRPQDSAIRQLIVAGPAGVWDLAGRHLNDSLKAALLSARHAASRCASTQPK